MKIKLDSIENISNDDSMAFFSRTLSDTYSEDDLSSKDPVLSLSKTSDFYEKLDDLEFNLLETKNRDVDLKQ